MTTTPRTLFEKIWDAHLVARPSADTPAVLYVDLHLIHEVTSPQAFTVLRERGLQVRRPERTLATMDHSTPTTPRAGTATIPMLDNAGGRAARASSRRTAREFGIELLALGSERQGIVHVIGPELGVTQPGMTIVCGDSHTSTHGAFGALAFGIGTSEVAHVLATQCLLQRKPKTLAIDVDGQLRPGVTAKDIILAIIGRLGVGGGTGHVIEYRGAAIRGALDGRAHDRLQHVDRGGRARRHDRARRDDLRSTSQGRPRAPQGAAWDAAVARWRTLPDRRGRDVRSRGDLRRRRARADDHLRHQPRHGHPDRRHGARAADATRTAREGARVHGPRGGRAAARPADRRRVHRQLHQLAHVATCARPPPCFEGRKVADGVRVLVVPGSQQVKRAGRGRGARPRVPRRGRRVARGRLLDVHRA